MVVLITKLYLLMKSCADDYRIYDKHVLFVTCCPQIPNMRCNMSVYIVIGPDYDPWIEHILSRIATLCYF